MKYIKYVLVVFTANYWITQFGNCKIKCANLKILISGQYKMYLPSDFNLSTKCSAYFQQRGWKYKEITLDFYKNKYFSNFESFIEGNLNADIYYSFNIHHKLHIAKSMDLNIGEKRSLDEVYQPFENLNLITNVKKLKTEGGENSQTLIMSNTTSNLQMGKTEEQALIGEMEVENTLGTKTQWVTPYYTATNPNIKKFNPKDLISSTDIKQYKIISNTDIDAMQRLTFFGSRKQTLIINIDNKGRYTFSRVDKNSLYKYLINNKWGLEDLNKLKQIDAAYDNLEILDVEMPYKQLVIFNIINKVGDGSYKFLLEKNFDQLSRQMVILNIKPGAEIPLVEAAVKYLMNSMEFGEINF